MADEGSTARQATTDEGSGVHRLRDIVVEEVSLVDRAANKRRFLLVKRSSQMADNGKPKGAGTSQEGQTGATRGTDGKKPRTKPDPDVDKARPRVMPAADDDEEDEEEAEKARRSEESDDEDDDEETDKARRSESEDEEDDDVNADKAAGEEDNDDEDEKDKPKRGRPASSGKRSARASKGASDPKQRDRAGKRSRKAEDDDLVLPAAAKNTVLRALAQALERLMAVANQIKEADEPDDETEVNVPDDLTEELEDIGELLEDVGEQLEEPAEKSRDKKPDAAKGLDAVKGRSAKADVNKAGRRMAKDRLERFQKALELLAAVLKELTDEKPAPTPSAGAAEKALGKREPADVGGLVASVQELTRVVKQQGAELGRLQKTRTTSNAIPIEGGGRRRDVQDVSWPLDMNRPITRDRVDKAISFYDEE